MLPLLPCATQRAQKGRGDEAEWGAQPSGQQRLEQNVRGEKRIQSASQGEG